MSNEDQSEGRYRVQSRSWHSAGVDRQVLTLRSDDEASTTRRVMHSPTLFRRDPSLGS